VSSYHRRALGQADDLLDDDPWYAGLAHTAQARAQIYREWVDASVPADEWDHIRKATPQGRVVGSETFQEAMGNTLGRRVTGETRGRPKRTEAS